MQQKYDAKISVSRGVPLERKIFDVVGQAGESQIQAW